MAALLLRPACSPVPPLSAPDNCSSPPTALTSSLLAFSCRTVLPSPSLTWAFHPLLPKVLPHSRRLHPLPTAASTTDDAVLELGEDAELSQEEEEEVSRTRLIAQNVPWTCSPEDVRSLFEKHGKVVEVELSMYSKNRNRGLAFVEMGSEEDASRALEALEASEFVGRTLKINYANPKKKPTPSPARSGLPPTFNLFVSNLSYEARAKDLREFFKSEIESVVSADIIFHDNPRRSSGYGFVSFKSKKDAEAALLSFQGKIFMGRTLRVYRSKQFVKVQRKESLPPDNDNPSKSLSDVQQEEKSD